MKTKLKVTRPPANLFGICPDCGAPAIVVNIGSYYHGVCHVHKKRWFLRRNLYNDWRFDPKSSWDNTRREIAEYEEVDGSVPHPLEKLHDDPKFDSGAK